MRRRVYADDLFEPQKKVTKLSGGRAIDLDPDHPDHSHIQGRILMGPERSQAALRAYEELTDRDPHAAYAFYLKAKMLLDLNRYEEAVVACEQAPDPSQDLVFQTTNARLMFLTLW